MERTFAFGDFEIDAGRRVLTRGGETVALNSKALDVLVALVENRGAVVSKDDLFETVWKGQIVEENNLTVHVAALRKALGEKKGENRFIVTVPGEGYKFVGEVKAPEETAIVIENRTIERITVDEVDESPLALPGKRKTSAAWIVAAVAVVAVVAVVGALFWFGRAKSAPIESIAVMPFVYEGGSPDSEFLSDGMTETLISNLSQLPKLTVKARASVFTYKGKEIDPRKVAGELSVQAVLLGRIKERGDQYVLSLELVDARTSNQLWGEQYTRKTSELATLQSDIARDVASKLSRRLGGETRLPGGGTTNAEAYQLYTRGRFFWNKRNHKDHVKALELFQQALALDPNFALAYAAIGSVNQVDTYKVPKEIRFPAAKAAALKALEIEPELAEAYTTLASVAWSEYDWEEAERNFQRAIAINPSFAPARQWHAEMLTRRGRFDEALPEIEHALELDPLSLIINSDATYIYAQARQYERSIAQANRTLELDPNWRMAVNWRSVAREYVGDFIGAADDLSKAIELSDMPAERKTALIAAFVEIKKAAATDGRIGYWKKTLEVCRRRPAEESEYYVMALAATNLGNVDEALEALETAFERKDSNIDLMKVEPAFDPIRNEPRFQALLKRMNLDK